MSPARFGRFLSSAWLLLALASPASADSVKLSDVVKEAKKPPDQQQVVGQQPLSETKTKETPPPPPDPPPQVAPREGEVVEYVVLGYPTSYGTPYYSSWGTGDAQEYLDGGGASVERRSDVRGRVGLVAGGGGLETDSIDGYGAGGLLLGFGSERVSLDLRGFLSTAFLAPELTPAFNTFDGWAADLALRLGLLPRSAPWGMNIMFAGRMGRYGWDYRNPVTVARPGGEHVFTQDSVGYTTFLAGLGFEPLRTGSISFGLTLAGGIQYFNNGTEMGFENDVFEDRGVVEMTGEIVYSPPWK